VGAPTLCLGFCKVSLNEGEASLALNSLSPAQSIRNVLLRAQSISRLHLSFVCVHWQVAWCWRGRSGTGVAQSTASMNREYEGAHEVYKPSLFRSFCLRCAQIAESCRYVSQYHRRHRGPNLHGGRPELESESMAVSAVDGA